MDKIDPVGHAYTDEETFRLVAAISSVSGTDICAIDIDIGRITIHICA